MPADSRTTPAEELSAAPKQRELLTWHVVRLTTAVRRAVTQRFRRMFDVSMIEWVVIAYLAVEPSVSLTALARNANLDAQRTSLAVARLAKRDLVTRTKNPENGRVVQVALTARGRAVFNAIIENWLDPELTHGFSAAELASAYDIVNHLADRADQILARELKSGGM
jgi:DNA-binding MarR family transcriptional regulator